MKKQNRLRAAAFLMAIACLMGAGACSSTQASSSAAPQSSSSQSDQSASGATSMETNVVYGKVTAVDGSKITLAVGTLKEEKGQGHKDEKGSGSQPAKKEPAQSRAASKVDSGSAPQQNGDGFQNMLALTGATKTITISNEKILSKQQMRGKPGPAQTASSEIKQQSSSASQTASLSDIQKGTVLKVVYQSDGTTLSSVVILGGGAKN